MKKRGTGPCVGLDGKLAWILALQGTGLGRPAVGGINGGGWTDNVDLVDSGKSRGGARSRLFRVLGLSAIAAALVAGIRFRFHAC